MRRRIDSVTLLGEFIGGILLKKLKNLFKNLNRFFSIFHQSY